MLKQFVNVYRLLNEINYSSLVAYYFYNSDGKLSTPTHILITQEKKKKLENKLSREKEKKTVHPRRNNPASCVAHQRIFLPGDLYKTFSPVTISRDSFRRGEGEESVICIPKHFQKIMPRKVNSPRLEL